ncbi:MAG: DUF2809 domain-containing protein [Candidatus Cloacimonetes bacterium]|nr:DUF2809 domain-containing protein [Candidatus Cloacimonadota bacterium]
MKKRLITLIFIFIIVPMGFYTKFYKGIYANWVNNSLCGVLYEIFWILFFYLFFPKLKCVYIVLIVFGATCILEFLQLWHPPFLQVLRANFIGVTILGNSFVWNDFPYYFIGSLFGWILIIGIDKRNF